MKKKITAVILSAMLLTVWVYAQTIQPADKATMDRGKKVYDQYCISCHQANGKGVPHLNPPLAAIDRIMGDKIKLIQLVLKGRDTHEPIDDEYYSNTMPPHQFLKDQEVADVLTFIRNSFGNKAVAVKMAEVKTVRAKIK